MSNLTPLRVPDADGFDFTSAMRRLAVDMCRRLPELAHIDMDRVAVSFCQARKNVPHGLQAALTPLRFAGGATSTRRNGRRYGCQRVTDDKGHEYLYILSFYLPRFLNHSVEEKLSTVIHELWHIGPEFDGDLRRHAGRCYAHGHSQREYDAHVDQLARQWLALDPPSSLYDFLEVSYDELVAQYGRVYGRRITTPRLLPLDVR
jgi:predicted metallopeptidase